MGNAASSLPYTIGRELSQLPDGWVLHEGARKADSLPVCVFTAKKPVLAKTPVDQRSSPQFSQLAPALQHFTNCRKLRHPQILSVHATLDTDHVQETSSSVNSSSSSHSLAQIATEQGDWLIVTEPCIPLAQWLATNPPLEQRAWGLECVIRAVHFLHASAQLSHGYLCPQALFVTPAGDVKVWSFGLATTVDATTGLSPTFVDYDALLMPQLYRSPERVEQRYKELAQTQAVHAMDAYSIGVLVSYFFDNHIPPPLVKAVQRLQTPNIRMRPRLQPLLKCPVFDTPYQKLQLQLEGFAMLAVEEKIQFWQTLLPQLQAQLLAAEVVKYKLWSMMTQAIVTVCTNDALKQQDLYRKEGMAR
jgi:SCY1-like protein 1